MKWKLWKELETPGALTVPAEGESPWLWSRGLCPIPGALSRHSQGRVLRQPFLPVRPSAASDGRGAEPQALLPHPTQYAVGRDTRGWKISPLFLRKNGYFSLGYLTLVFSGNIRGQWLVITGHWAKCLR